MKVELIMIVRGSGLNKFAVEEGIQGDLLSFVN